MKVKVKSRPKGVPDLQSEPSPEGQLVARAPKNREELWWYIKAVWGVEMPRTKVCADHSTPFEALAQAYFAEYPVTIWKGSRGFGGKSFTLALLSQLEATTFGAQITILGGSASQSQRVVKASQELWYSDNAPRDLLAADPTQYETKLTNGGYILALMASQKSVRGPHPQRLRLDEIDEMELAILEAAQGQPMTKNGIKAQTVMSSTHQYPDGTMTEMLRRANDRGWPVHDWCFHETIQPYGWLDKEMVFQQRASVSERMWLTEFCLQEPSFEGRSISTEFVEWMFDKSLGWFAGDVDQKCTIEEPVVGGSYVTGVDWAKEKDWTIIATYRTDVQPWLLVSWMRTGRKPWPEMVRDVEMRLFRYGGRLVHDATGIGDVVDDLIGYDRRMTSDVVLRGRDRESTFTEYISGIEQRAIKAPYIEFAANEHKYVRDADLFKTGGHPPDSFIAGALAWKMRRRASRLILSPGVISKTEPPNKSGM